MYWEWMSYGNEHNLKVSLFKEIFVLSAIAYPRFSRGWNKLDNPVGFGLDKLN